jgi:hypothetical protein
VTPVMKDKLEEIPSGKKEGAPAAENDATSVGGGTVATAEARAADTRGEAAVPAHDYCRHQGGCGGSKDQCR